MNFPTPLKMQTSWAEKSILALQSRLYHGHVLSRAKERGKEGQRDIIQTSSTSWMPMAQWTWYRAAWCFQASPSLRSLVAGNGNFQWGLATGPLTSPSVAPGGTGTKGFGFKYEDCTSQQPKLGPLEICFLQHLFEALDTSVDTVSEFAGTGLLQCYHTGEAKGTMVLQQHRDKRGETTSCCPNPTADTLQPTGPLPPQCTQDQAGLSPENLLVVMYPSQGLLQLSPKSTNTAKD